CHHHIGSRWLCILYCNFLNSLCPKETNDLINLNSILCCLFVLSDKSFLLRLNYLP
uniref:Uncharacterized protein n=1 Tax=Aegilops tauschii subsp. strangulata TaxID=200361 RepID=A0A453SX05_AEGTS